jgi:opacity protein-like surface antigen
MNYKKLILPAFAFLFLIPAVQAQKGNARMDINYNAALPVGSFRDHVSNTSFRGFNGSALFGLNDKLSLGLGVGFQDFYQKKPRQLYKLSDGSDVSAVLTNSIQTIPIMVQAKYAFSPGATVQPYASLGVGGNLISYSQLLGEFGGQEAKVGLAARPEAGVFIPFKKGGENGLNIGASYSIMPFDRIGIKHLNSVGIHAGISIPLRK